MSVGSFFYFLLLFFLDLCLFTYFGQFLVFLTPSQGFAQIIASGESLIAKWHMHVLLDIEVLPADDVRLLILCTSLTCVRMENSKDGCLTHCDYWPVGSPGSF